MVVSFYDGDGRLFEYNGKKLPYQYNASDKNSWSVQAKAVKKLIANKSSFKTALEQKAIIAKKKS